MGVNQNDCETRKGSLLFLIYVLFNHYQGVNASEYCQTPDGVKECDTGCCGEHWRNNVSCCPFHPSAFIMIVLAVVLVIIFVSYCIISSLKRWNRRKTVIKPNMSRHPKQVPSVSYVVVAPGSRQDYPYVLPPPYSEEWIYSTDATYPQRPNYQPR